jgi:hypothetical protein
VILIPQFSCTYLSVYIPPKYTLYHLQLNRFTVREHLKFYKHIFYGSSTSGSTKFCGEASVPSLGHIGPQPSDPRPDKVGTEPKPPTYILRRHLSFCFPVRRFRTRVLPSSLTFLYNFNSARKHEVLRFLDKLRLNS